MHDTSSAHDTSSVLIIGYGNSLRTDDGVGWHAMDSIRTDVRFSDCAQMQLFQLTPELAYDIAAADLVVLIDARESHDDDPGTITTRDIHPDDSTGGISSHHVTPEALLHLTQDLCQTLPRVVAVEVAAKDFTEGTELSSQLHAAIPTICDTVAHVLFEHGEKNNA